MSDMSHPPTGTGRATLRDDPLWRLRAYRLAIEAMELAWDDATALAPDHRCRSMADQLHRAVGSIGANIAEGYSRGGGRDRARFYEYALGSAREARHWYVAAEKLLGQGVITDRIARTNEICRLLISIAREERRASVGTF